ncbi:MAG: DUF4339 domain-containing protein [Verrucomicrobiaceae bacterium]|nr:DUF4339 domain-containing protein [Verrucomicrobiaceae bacterium]
MNPDSKTDLASLLWFYSVNQAVTGPVSFQELASHVQSGTLPSDVLAVPEGREDWKAFSQWQASSPPPPLPIKSSATEKEDTEAPSGGLGAFPGRKGGKAARQEEGCRKGCFGCLGLIVVCMLLGMILETCSKPDLTLSDSERQNPKEAVQKLMKGVYGSALRETSATEIGDSSIADGKLNVYVRVNADLRLSGSSNMFQLEQKLNQAFKTLYTSGLPIWEVVIWNYGELVDRYGNESDEIVHKCSLHSNEAAKVNWQNAEWVSLEKIWEVRLKHRVLE